MIKITLDIVKCPGAGVCVCVRACLIENHYSRPLVSHLSTHQNHPEDLAQIAGSYSRVPDSLGLGVTEIFHFSQAPRWELHFENQWSESSVRGGEIVCLVSLVPITLAAH